MKQKRRQCLSQQVSYLLFGLHMNESNSALLNQFPHKVIIYVNMFGTFMEAWTRSNMDCRLAVTEKPVRSCLYLQISQDCLQPLLETAVSAIYSTSAEDLDTVCCFLDFHEISECPRNTQNPVVDLLVSMQLPQPASV